MQGNVDDSSGKLSSGGLVVEIWDGPDVAGSNLVYNSTDNFTGSGNISSGKFDIVLGDALDKEMLNLEYGKVYYMDMYVEGEDMNFSGKERQAFMSSVGTINSSFLNQTNEYTMSYLLITNVTADNVIFNVSNGDDMIVVNATGTDFDAGTLHVDKVNNRVGIGTAAPSRALDVNGHMAVYNSLRVNDDGAADAWELWVVGDAYASNKFSSGGSLSATTTITSGDYIAAAGGVHVGDTSDPGTDNLIVDGNTGLGTTTPSHTLNVNGDTNITGVAYIGNSTLYVNGSSVGIGNIVPEEKLHIKNATGDVGAIIESTTSKTTFIDLLEVGRGSEIGGRLQYDGNLNRLEMVTWNSGSIDANRISMDTGTGEVNIRGVDNEAAADAFTVVDENGIEYFKVSSTGAGASEKGQVHIGGKLGIGTTSPATKLEIAGDGSENLLNITDGTVNAMYIEDGGDVGMGTTTPITSLDIRGGNVNDGDDSEVISMGRNQGNSVVQIASYRDGVDYDLLGLKLRVHDSTDQNDAPMDAVTITPSGNVGIGTISPRAKLEVVNDTGTLLNISTGSETILYANGSNVGINTTSPEFKLTIENDGGILAKGTYNSGAGLSTSGDGERFIWYPKKAAIRAGGVTGTQWDDTNIGAYSTAFGYNAQASNAYAVAMGRQVTATGVSGVAIGYGANAGGSCSFAIGRSADAGGEYAAAIGRGTLADGADSYAFGKNMELDSSADNSIALGTSDEEVTISQPDSIILYNNYTGIGTTAPAAALEVVNLSAVDAHLNISDGTESLLLVNGTGLSIEGDASVIRITDTKDQSWDDGDKLAGFEVFTSDTSGNYPAVGAAINAIHTTGDGVTSPRIGWTFLTNNGNAVPSESMRLSATGMLRIGSGVTSNQLDVYAQGNTWTDASNAQVRIWGVDNDAAAPMALLIQDEQSNTYFSVASTQGGNTDQGQVHIGGKLGIGTTAPAAALEVVNSSAVDAYLNISDSLKTRLLIDTIGQVGIGVAPSYKFHVSHDSGATYPDFYFDESGNMAKIGTTLGSDASIVLYDGATGHMTLTTGFGSGDIIFEPGNSESIRFDSTGSVVIGGTDAAENSSMKLTIVGGDLNVSGAVFSSGNVLSSPFVVKSVDEEPIPMCMKNSAGVWVGCMPDENNNWKCEHNEECDEKILGLETTWKLKAEGAGDEEVDKKVSAIKKKFKDGKDLKTIKNELKAEIGDMNVLNELDDTAPTSYGIQTSSEEVNALATEMNSLKSENELLKSELCKKDNTYSWCTVEEPEEEPVEEQPEEEQEEEPVEEPSQEPIINSAPVIDSFAPENTVPLYIGESQEFTVSASDADEDELSMQWFVNDVAVDGAVFDVYEFSATEIGEFEIKVLVNDNKDSTTKKWTLTVSEQPAEQQPEEEPDGGFSITGAAVGVANQGSSLLNWLKSLF